MKISQILEAKHIGNEMSPHYFPQETDNVRCGKCKATYTMHRFLLRKGHQHFTKVSECPACEEYNYHELLEAKHSSQTPENLADHLIKIVEDAFEFVYPDDYETQEDYTDALITLVMKNVEKALPNDLKKTFTDAVWTTYHDLDESEFADVESFVDALFNEIKTDIRWWSKRVKL